MTVPKIQFNVNNSHKLPPKMLFETSWVCWMLEKRGKKWTKPPYKPDGSLASSTKPADWSTFEQVTSALASGKFSGIGYVIRPDAGQVWIDIDHCRNPDTGEIVPWAADIVKRCGNSYIEISPSGDGLHIGLMGAIPESAKFTVAEGQPHAEIYNGGRYFTVTACPLNGAPPLLVENQPAIDFAYRYIQNRKILSRFRLHDDQIDKILNGVPVGQRSEAGASIIMSLLNSGATDEHIQAIFEQFPIGEKFREKGSSSHKWLQSEIGRARKVQRPGEQKFKRKPTGTVKTSDIIQLKRDTPPAEPFPVDALPGDLAKLVNEAVSVIQCPEAMVAGSLLSSLSLVAQRLVDVSVDGRRCPSSLFVSTIALSGERKSTVDSLMTAPIEAHERKQIELYMGEKQRFQSDLYAYNKKRDAVVKSCGKDTDAISRKLAELGPPPIEPPCRGILIKDCTIEGLIKMMLSGASSVGMFLAEGGGFLGGYSMKQENRIKTISTMSSLWDGASIPISRAGENSFQYLFGKRVSVHLQIQPSLVDMIFGDRQMEGQGLFNRFLISWPDTVIGDRPYQAQNIREFPSFKKYYRVISECLESTDCLKHGSDTELDIKEMTLDSGSKRSFVAFFNDVERWF